MTIFLSEHDAARLGIAGAKAKKRPAKDTRPALPRGPVGEGDRIAQLTRIAAYGFSPRWDNGLFCFWNCRTGARTTAHAEYARACVAAEREVGG